jgi:hypothetical protein
MPEPSPAEELRTAAERCRADAVEFNTELPSALGDLLEALSYSDDLTQRNHDGCDPTCCPSWAAMKLARRINEEPT